MRKLILVLMVLRLMLQTQAYASIPYPTVTYEDDGTEVLTQTTFLPLGQFQKDNRLISPEDLFIDHQNQVYVVDSGTKSVLKYDQAGEEIAEFGAGVLVQPTGLFVSEQGDLFVADYGASKIVQINQDNEIVNEYEKPDSPLFGARSSFKPTSVVLDRRGNLYVISEGSTNGIIQLSKEGEFLGYYGVNRTQNAFTSVIQEMLSLDSRLFSRNPPAPQNIAIDEQGLIYSITQGAEIELIKKLNVAGDNMLPLDVASGISYVDITVDQHGNMFAIDTDGIIHEYDSFGNLLFLFSGPDEGFNQWGLSQQASSIAIDTNGFLYVADRERGIIQRFGPTAFINEVHAGIALFKEGLYVESREYWENVLDLNTSFGLAHTAMGRAYFKEQRYDEALEQYKLANDRSGYSEAFWERRHAWLQNYLGIFILVLIGLMISWSSLKYADRKTGIVFSLRERLPSPRLLKDLAFVGYFIKHPIDGFYYIRKGERSSVLSAGILYVLLVLIYLYSRLQTGFIFTVAGDADFVLVRELLIVIGPVALFIVSNYLVSTINDGQGRFKDIFIGTIYALAPFLLFMVPVTLLSKVLTLNEAFIYQYSIVVIFGWCLLILYFMVKEIHNYMISETVRNILLTIFGMIMLVLVGFILYILLNQVIDFLFSVVSEVMVRV
ncbi:YIP1 family protein [Jeotgalibacillus proteolyticus]|uniref:Yip1 domain-containing protein n=1 Tax=Jeotgalibacillus proteolyticus TaxID=2082395 RepID=A0A2S5GA17_9BACL|nr:YIP1 family protein [Jeotgalibacillus proteolyticus]PPA69836.1 hypothetical protein C4B60_15000 [Jeotgalibacillus proteolyticus]